MSKWDKSKIRIIPCATNANGNKIELLRPHGPDKTMTLSGPGTLEFEHEGQVITVKLEAGSYDVVNGQVIPR